jgi:protein-disulfide isomerase
LLSKEAAVIISRQILSAVLVLLVVASLSVYKFVILKGPGPVALDLHTKAQIKGSPLASVKIVEFTDFQCPACANANAILEAAMKKYDGKISLEHNHFPLAMHAHARRASIFAECAADQGKFWPFQEVLFKSQKSWAGMTVVDAYFSELGVSMGLNGPLLAACVNSESAKAGVDKDVEEGKKLGVKSTPTFFINGKMVVGGTGLDQELKSLLEKK